MMYDNKNKAFLPPKSDGAWRYVGLALVAHAVLLAVFLWDTLCINTQIKYQALLAPVSQFPKLDDVPIEREPLPITIDTSKPHLQSVKAKALLVSSQDRKTADFSAQPKALSIDKKMFADQHLDAKLQKSKVSSHTSQGHKKEQELEIAKKQRELVKQLEKKQSQLKSKQVVNKESNDPLTKKDGQSKKDLDNLNEAYRRENIQRMHRLIESH